MSSPDPPSQRHALVTDAAGFIGSLLVGQLLSKGWQVKGPHDFDSPDRDEAMQTNLASARQRERLCDVAQTWTSQTKTRRLLSSAPQARFGNRLATSSDWLGRQPTLVLRAA